MSPSGSALLQVDHLACFLGREDPIFHDVNFEVNEGDVIVLQGKSGCGKSTLLKCLAHLNAYKGEISYRGKSVKDYGFAKYRTRVLYVPQRQSMLPGTPRDFLTMLQGFTAYKAHMNEVGSNTVSNEARAIDFSEQWGIGEDCWDRSWSSLSGGESQRVALAVALGLNGNEILLLDEPTSALDPGTSALVEEHLAGMLQRKESMTKAIVWITHSAEQASRVGTRFLTIQDGTVHEGDQAFVHSSNGSGSEIV